MAAERPNKAIHDLVDATGLEIWVCGEYCPNRPWRDTSQGREADVLGINVAVGRHNCVVNHGRGRGDVSIIRVVTGAGAGHCGVRGKDEGDVFLSF